MLCYRADLAGRASPSGAPRAATRSDPRASLMEALDGGARAGRVALGGGPTSRPRRGATLHGVGAWGTSCACAEPRTRTRRATRTPRGPTRTRPRCRGPAYVVQWCARRRDRRDRRPAPRAPPRRDRPPRARAETLSRPATDRGERREDVVSGRDLPFPPPRLVGRKPSLRPSPRAIGTCGSVAPAPLTANPNWRLSPSVSHRLRAGPSRARAARRVDDARVRGTSARAARRLARRPRRRAPPPPPLAAVAAAAYSRATSRSR